MSRIDLDSFQNFHRTGQIWPDADPVRLVEMGLDYATRGSGWKAYVRLVADCLAKFECTPEVDPAYAVSARILDLSVDRLFEIGWQPAELAHATRKMAGGAAGMLVVEAIATHAGRSSALTNAPDSWREQLIDLKIDSTAGVSVERLRMWCARPRVSTSDSWNTVLTVLGHTTSLGSLDKLVPIPSQWSSVRSSPAPSSAHKSGVSDPKMLGKIRGLLAKAESTQFPAEAEAFSAKAQDLMTRYAIDHALLESDNPRGSIGDVTTRRILVDSPYSEAKSLLLHSVCEANGARTLWYKRFALVNIVGLEVDLDLCELLFTSLLVQSSRALDELAESPEARGRSFRKSFLIAYAHRIGQRLLEARERATKAASEHHGSALLPILAERSDAVNKAFTAMYPSTTEVRIEARDHAGRRAGRAAAERADLTGGRERIDKSDLAS
ncbi:DUF2786 domain-containing protein [Rhodococcus fascians]|nr:DUF2786 domain-containing protein [Rhodococcus fascians]MBY4140148.1 DUF2786 domain-containing protein [Rhodococcus fascians]MBY4218813.1 DUF2786 domain-containing protein [Rhodococcus fascians]MBY4223923.1 DUF2786 domain-containing protein [Rhodococcus fascians]MBY4234174.1 DUF2786 domain-containing protein [Rhodococcus fascians]